MSIGRFRSMCFERRLTKTGRRRVTRLVSGGPFCIGHTKEHGTLAGPEPVPAARKTGTQSPAIFASNLPLSCRKHYLSHRSNASRSGYPVGCQVCSGVDSLLRCLSERTSTYVGFYSSWRKYFHFRLNRIVTVTSVARSTNQL